MTVAGLSFKALGSEVYTFFLIYIFKNLEYFTYSERYREYGNGNPLLALRIPWTEEPCGLQSMGLLRVKHD